MEPARPDAAEVTVRQLVALDVMASATLVGGMSGLDSVVADVLAAATFELGELPPSTLVVLDGSQLKHDSYQIDLALRAVEAQGGVGLVVTAPSTPVGIAAGRLAEKIGIPLVVTPQRDPMSLADLLRQAVATPQLEIARSLLGAVELLRTSSGADLKASLARLSSLLGAPLTLVGIDGQEIAGEVLDPPLDPHDRPPVPMTTHLGDVVQLAHPVQLTFGERPSFWLVARRVSPARMWVASMTEILQVAAWAFGARLVAGRLQNERDARFRLGVLNSIVAAAEGPGPGLVEQISVLGWRLDGWCTAVHVQATGDIDQQRVLSITEDLGLALQAAGMKTPLVERPDGWTFWLESLSQPSTTSYVELERNLLSAIQRVTATHDNLNLHAGIGLPYHGFGGLQSSLSEAREASIIAQAGGGAAVVQHIDALGVKRILFGWYASDTFEEFARTLLAPLTQADPSGEIIATLECFLDAQSSPTLTAARMFIHRNTVLNRMERVRRLLTVDLDDPDQRLAVQLACRMLRVRDGTDTHQ